MVEFSHYSYSNARTAGASTNQYKTVQAWKSRQTAPESQQETALAASSALKESAPQRQAETQILANLEKAADGKIGTFDVQLETSLSYANATQNVHNDAQNQSSESFQFSDVVDIVNPLQHLPVVSMIYRGITGDKLHPMSQIIGGALYGGPIGAVTGTANAISQMQTGKDLSAHALGLVGIGNGTQQSTADKNDPLKNDPLAQLNKVATTLNNQEALEEPLGSALSFVNLSEPNKAYERIKMADGRTAGSMIVKRQTVGYRQSINNEAPSFGIKNNLPLPNLNINELPVREKITSVTLSAMPPPKDV